MLAEYRIAFLMQITVRLTGEKAMEMFELIAEIKRSSVYIHEMDQNLDTLQNWAEETKDRHIEKIGSWLVAEYIFVSFLLT